MYTFLFEARRVGHLLDELALEPLEELFHLPHPELELGVLPLQRLCLLFQAGLKMTIEMRYGMHSPSTECDSCDMMNIEYRVHNSAYLLPLAVLPAPLGRLVVEVAHTAVLGLLDVVLGGRRLGCPSAFAVRVVG